jgi:hypothetical protein
MALMLPGRLHIAGTLQSPELVEEAPISHRMPQPVAKAPCNARVVGAPSTVPTSLLAHRQNEQFCLRSVGGFSGRVAQGNLTPGLPQNGA